MVLFRRLSRFYNNMTLVPVALRYLNNVNGTVSEKTSLRVIPKTDGRRQLNKVSVGVWCACVRVRGAAGVGADEAGCFRTQEHSEQLVAKIIPGQEAVWCILRILMQSSVVGVQTHHCEHSLQLVHVCVCVPNAC